MRRDVGEGLSDLGSITEYSESSEDVYTSAYCVGGGSGSSSDSPSISSGGGIGYPRLGDWLEFGAAGKGVASAGNAPSRAFIDVEVEVTDTPEGVLGIGVKDGGKDNHYCTL